MDDKAFNKDRDKRRGPSHHLPRFRERCNKRTLGITELGAQGQRYDQNHGDHSSYNNKLGVIEQHGLLTLAFILSEI